GAAVYTIPIELPEGRGGMTPQLALQYNSSAGDGILGKGWGLSGWSYISRVAETPYYDGAVGSVDFVNDGFALDGMRLIRVPNTNTYRTEVDEISRITAHQFGKQENSSNSYFTLETKTGIKKYYGATDGSYSRQYYGTHVTFPVRWHIDKISDLSGNCIFYHYNRNETNGEIYLSKIDYSLNDNAGTDNTQFYTVEFLYTDIPTSSQFVTTFLNSNNDVYKYEIRKRLTNIKIKQKDSDNETLLFTYEISYELGGILNNQYLKSIQLLSGNGTQSFSPTSFSWDYNTVTDYSSQADLVALSTLNTPPSPFFESIVADIDGNGKDDLIEHFWSSTKIYLNGASTISHTVSNFQGKTKTGDFDGDGINELIISSNNKTRLYKFNGAMSQVGNEITGTVAYIGDFNGDGQQDAILEDGSAKTICLGINNLTQFLETTNRKPLTGLENTIYKLGHFTGSSATGMLKVNGLTLLHYSIQPSDGDTYELSLTFSHELELDKHFLDIGDFNGDGKDDIIVLNKTNLDVYSTYIKYSFGKGFTSEKYDMGLNYDWSIKSRLGDINNDNITDIISIGEVISMLDNIQINYKKLIKKHGVSSGFLSNDEIRSINFVNAPDKYLSHFHLANLNGNGENDVLFAIQGGLQRKVVFAEENKISTDVIGKINNGFEVLLDIDYQAYLPTSNYVNSFSHPISIYRHPFTIISKINEVKDLSNPSNYVQQKQFVFEDLLIHTQGKSILGYKHHDVIDFYSNTRTTTSNELHVSNNKLFFLFPKESKTYYTNQESSDCLSETVNNMQFKQTVATETRIFLPVISSSYTKSWDLNGTYKGIQLVKQDLWNVDEYGNLLMKEVLSDEFKTSTEGSDWNWQSQYWTFYNHVTDNGKWHSRLTGTVAKAKCYELDEWKFESTENEYYDNGLLMSTKSIAGYNQFNSPLVKKVDFDYDIYGNIIKKTLSAPNNAQLPNRVIEYEYGSTYKSRFLTMQTVKDPSGNSSDDCTVYEYYPDKGLLKEKKELYNISTSTSPVVTKYEYDLFGRLLKTTHPDLKMSFTETSFSGTTGGEVPVGAVVKIKSYTKTLNDQNWGVTTGYLDKYGNQLRSVGQNLLGTYIYVDKKYDEYNRLTEETEPYNAGSPTNLKISYTYDELGRPSTSMSSNGTIIKTTYKGRAVRTKNLTSMVWTEKVVNAIGLLDLVIDTLSSLDASAIINNNYDGLGRPISTVAFYKTTSFEYDAAGNQSKLIDPNAGTSIYTYNAFGELLTQQDARGNIYQMIYDGFGRINTKSLISDGSDVTTYTYNNTVGTNGFGQLQNLARSNGTSQAFAYDNLGRILTKTEIVDGNSFTFAYTYNASTGMLETYEYPSGYKLKYLYDSMGNQHEVRTADLFNTLLWKANAENQRGQLTQATMGNGTITDYEWDTYGFPQRNKVSKGSTILQNLTFSFNSVTGNLNARSDAKSNNILETFDYDNLLKDRLTYWSATNGSAKTMAYASNGNVLKKSDVSTSNTGYLYETAKPNAVTKVVSPTSSFQQNAQPQSITYTSTNKVEHVLNNDVLSYQLHLTYGVDDQRVKSFMNKVTGNPSVPEVMKYYLDNYEYEYRNESYRHLHYLQGPDGLFAIMVQQGTSQSMYYVHKDYLGSLTAISDATGNLIESLSYDPWGRRRNASNWNDFNVSSTMFDRGFTGHEHLPQFGLINMNGRVYDPFLARFLSPDPFVQAPDYSQNFNRYSYAFNNPLKYTDPDGEWVHLVVGAVIGGVINWAANGAEFSAKGLGHFGVGALAGALGAGVGAGINTAIAGGSFGAGFLGTTTVASTGFGAGFATGFTGGFTNGLVSGTGNSLVNNENIGQALEKGVNMAFNQGIAGGISGGVFGGIDALSKKLDFFSGKGDFDLSGGYGAHNIEDIKRNIKGKYVGTYEGVNVYESEAIGCDRLSGGISLPGRGIMVGEGSFSRGTYPELLQHEFAHILQARDVGLTAYYGVIAPESLQSAIQNDSYGHSRFWTETWANYMSSKYFGSKYIYSEQFPIQNISVFNYLRLRTFSPFFWP
ncbi:MAG: RHS repeat-associated core domain protein, partial [Bacteroidetes bacterium]